MSQQQFVQVVTGTPGQVSTAFGRLATAEPITVAEFKFTDSHLDSRLYETFSAAGGAVTVGRGGFATVANTSTIGSYATVRTRRPLQYRPGVGAAVMFAAAFDSSATALTVQAVGLGNQGNGLQFGYDGSSFGVLRTHGGRAGVVELTITVASTVAANCRVTLDGVNYDNPVTAAGTVEDDAEEIASGSFGGLWNAEARGGVVIFSKRALNAGTTHAFDALTTGMTAATVLLTDGVPQTTSWTAREDWNCDTLDGTAGSAFAIDPAKFNVYMIQMQWLGAGTIQFFVEDPGSGRFVEVHRIKYPNTSTVLTLEEPDMFIQASVASLGATTPVSMMIGSAVAQHQVSPRNPAIFPVGAAYASRSSVSTEEPILSIRVPLYRSSGAGNFITVLPMLASAASSGSATVHTYIYRNATLTAPRWDAGTIAVDVDTSATGISGGDLILAFANGRDRADAIDLSMLQALLAKGDTLTITGESGSNATIEAALTWQERY